MGEEKQKHLILKKEAKKILLEEGFKEEEIYFEKKIFIKKNSRVGFVIDVVGINNEKRIFIECGNTTDKKLKEIINYCDKFIYLPYLNSYDSTKLIIRKNGKTLDIKDEVYVEWVKFYDKQDKLKYPTLKNFTARKLREIIENE